jgi:hypothetical protein
MPNAQSRAPKPEPVRRPPLSAYADHEVSAELVINNNGW